MNAAKELWASAEAGGLPDRSGAAEGAAEQQSLAQIMFENAPIPCVIASDDGRIQLINPAFTQLLGYDMPDVSGTSIEAITHADDRLATGERVRFMLSGPDHAFCFVKRYVHKSGRIVSARVTASSVSHRGRRLLLAQICDFSDLAHAHERLEIAAENTGLGVWEADLQTLGMAWDTNLRRLYELPADAADPTIPEWLAMVVDEDRAQVQTRVAGCLAVNGENEFNVEFRINRRSNGGARHKAS